NQNSAELLKQLGLKPTKDNIALAQTLLDDHIRFNPDQLKKAFLILEKESDKEQTKSILKHMLAGNLPVTKSVFEALMSQNEILLDVSAQQKEFFKALKLIGVIKTDVDFEVWKRNLEPFLTQNLDSNPNVSKYTSHDAKSVLNISSKYVIEAFNHLVSNREL